MTETRAMRVGLAACRAALSRRRSLRRRFGAGFTLIEMMLTIAILGTLSAVAVPRLQGAVEKARIAHAIGDIRAMQTDIDGTDPPPASLAAIGRANVKDPWGNNYVYVYHGGDRGLARKDRFQVPLNSEYDLYSMGKDGSSAPALTAASSKDDIVRANDGWVGLAINF